MNTEFWAISFPAPGSAIRTAQRIEAEGWDGLLFTDSQHHNADVYQALAVAATVTEKIGLGTGVTNPVTRNAAVTAAAIASLQVQSNGRAVLGIGRGDSSLGHLGLKPAPVAVLEDYLIKVQGYLRGEAVVQNDHAAHLKWLPEDQPKVPVDVAATGPRVSALAGRIADWVTFAVGADPERLLRNTALARNARSEAGEDPDTLKVGAYLNISAHPDVAVARRVVRGSVGTMAHFSSMPGSPLDEVRPEDREVIRHLGENYDLQKHGDVGARHLARVDDAFIDRIAIVDTPARCVERIAGLLERVPLQRICILTGSRGADITETREVNQCLAQEVLPKLRG
ncbi:MAG: LLM class flavin-dependent oxidoreductase [Gammaproteobacteria bacterium]|nr:LLM class flavin-dependent oxidoreductase [Gammaproteobacteria bacterium]